MRAGLLVAAAVAPAAGLLAGGCFNQVQEHCPACLVIDARAPKMPPLEPRRSVVVLVPGALGFGDEWEPVVATLRRSPNVEFFVLAWPGPWKDPSRPARLLLAVLQNVLDHAPPTVRELLVLAHSAGGMLGDYAARRLRVPPGRHVRLATIAAPPGINVAPFVVEEAVNTPLGLAMGGTQEAEPAIPPGVEIVEYRTEDAPPTGRSPQVVYLGARAGHNRAVALAALPLIFAIER
jgi:hypothetical protein